MSTKTAKRTKAAPRTRKSTAPAGAKHANANPLPVPNLAPNAVEIPSTDALMGAQFSANVNCKTHTIQRGKRKGQPVRRCDRQRLTVVGGATPSSDHPRRKQLFAVQSGSRFTIPDREIRRDLRDAGRVRGGESCDTYRERLVEGRSVPKRAYDACPGLDAVEPRSGGDTSFEFKENGRKPAFALVSSRGLDDIVVSPHSTRESAEAAMRRKGFDPTAHPSFHGGYRVADLSGYDIIEPFGQKMLRPKRNGVGNVPVGDTVIVRPVYKMPWGIESYYRPAIGRFGVVERGPRSTAGGHTLVPVRFKDGRVYRVATEAMMPASSLSEMQRITLTNLANNIEDALRSGGSVEWLNGGAIIRHGEERKRNHHGGYHAPGDPLGVYFAKPNRAPRGAVAGQTYADSREDDLTGRRVSGERYAGEVRGRAVGCDGKTPSHIVGGHIVPRSHVASAVRRETKEMDKQIRAAAFKSRYGTFDAPQSMAVYDADEGLARMAEIEAAPEARALVRRAFDEVYPESAPAPLQLGPGPSFGAGEIEPLRPSARAHERFRGRFGAGTAEELRPRPATPTAAVSDADLAAMFMEEAAKLGLVKQNRRFHAARYPTRRR